MDTISMLADLARRGYNAALVTTAGRVQPLTYKHRTDAGKLVDFAPFFLRNDLGCSRLYAGTPAGIEAYLVTEAEAVWITREFGVYSEVSDSDGKAYALGILSAAQLSMERATALLNGEETISEEPGDAAEEAIAIYEADLAEAETAGITLDEAWLGSIETDIAITCPASSVKATAANLRRLVEAGALRHDTAHTWLARQIASRGEWD